MFDVGVVGHFEATHHLVGDFGPASQPHSHHYRIEVSVNGPELQSDGTLFDISVLQSALSQLISSYRGHHLNDLPGLAQPTAEIVARHAFGRLASAVRGRGLSHLSVRVWESEEAFASYSGDC
jgi:6-pyruvoyltetrahydropterin/6-carboxytetrahydropterin synthase